MADPDPIVQKIIIKTEGGGGGGPPLDELREKIRTLIAEIDRLNARQAAMFEEVAERQRKAQEAFATMGVHAFEDLNKGIANTVESIKGTVTDLNQALQNMLTGVFTQEQVALVEKYFGSIEEGASFAATQLGTSFEKVSQGTGKYVENIRLLVGVVDEGVVAQGALQASNMKNLIELGRVEQKWETMTKVGQDFQKIMTESGISTEAVVEKLHAYGEGVDKANESLRNTQGFAGAAATGIRKVVDAASEGGPVLDELASKAGAAFQNIADLANKQSVLWTGVSKDVKNFQTAFRDLGEHAFDDLDKSISESVEAIKGPITELQDALKSMLAGTMDDAKAGVILRFFKTIEDGAAFMATQLGSSFEKLATGSDRYVKNLRMLTGVVQEGVVAQGALQASNMANLIDLGRVEQKWETMTQVGQDFQKVMTESGISTEAVAAKLKAYGLTQEQTNAILAEAAEAEKKLADARDDGGGVTEEQTQKIVALAEALKGTLDSIAHIATGMTTLAVALARFGPAGQAVATVLRTVSGVLSAVDTTAGTIVPAIDKLAESLKKLGPAGQAAGEALQRMIDRMVQVVVRGEGVYGIFERLGIAIRVGFNEAIAAALALLGPWGLAIAAIVAALALLTGAIIYFGNQAIQAATRIRELSEATGQTGEEIQRGEAAFRRMGIETEKYGEIARNVADIVAEMGPTMGAAMDAAADKMEATTEAALKAEEAMLEAKAAAQGPAIVGQDWSQQIVDAERLREVRRQLYSEEDKAARAIVEHEQQQRRLREARANDLLTLIPMMKRAAEGAKGITFDGMTTGASKIEAAKRAITQLGQDGQNAMGGLIEMLKSLGARDALEVGKAFGVSEEDIFRVRRLGTSWKELNEQLRATGQVPITEDDAERLEKASKSVNRLRDSWNHLQDVLQTPVFSTATGEAAASLDELAAKALDTFSHILEGWIIIFRKIGTYLRTFPDDVNASLSAIKELWFSAWAAMADAVGNLFAKIPGLRDAGASLKGLAESWRATAEQAAADVQASQEKIRAEIARTEQVATRSGRQVAASAEETGLAADHASQGFLTWGQVLNRFNGDAQKAAEYVANLKEEGSKVAEVGQEFVTWGEVLRRNGGDLQKAAEDAANLGKAGAEAGQQITKGLEDTAKPLKEFKDEIAEPPEPPDFSSVTGAAEKASQTVTQTFAQTDLSPLSTLTVDFSSIVTSAKTAADEVKTAFQSIGTEGFAKLTEAAQAAFDVLNQQVATTAQGIANAFREIDFKGLVTQINNATTAFGEMEQAAWAAAEAARAAASEGGGGGAGEEFGFGGLFRGNPGTDTNLAWLSDYEFVMRREAVQKYGVSFMQLINAGRFAEGGLVKGGISITTSTSRSGTEFGVVAPTAEVQQAIESAIVGIADLFKELGLSIFRSLTDMAKNLLDGVVSAQQSMIEAVGQLSAAVFTSGFHVGVDAQKRKAEEEAGEATERGSGGLFRGRPGRDTNLAWLTDYEYVMRPEAVQKYGVAFMELINGLAFPFGGFRNGGLMVPQLAIPAFRAGGINSNGGGGGMVGRPLTLVLDGQRFPNLSGPAAVVDGLEKHATLKKASRVGRAPSWVK